MNCANCGAILRSPEETYYYDKHTILCGKCAEEKEKENDIIRSNQESERDDLNDEH